MRISYLLACILAITMCQQSAGKMYEAGITNQYGRIGVKVSPLNGLIGYVYEYCPAREAGLRPGDKILEADGVKGTKRIDGIAGTHVRIKVRMRTGEVYTMNILRVPPEEIYDAHLEQHVWTEIDLTWKRQS